MILNFKILILTSIIFFIYFDLSYQHGFLIEPPSRTSAWKVDHSFYNCCQNYNDNQMFCGGVQIQWFQNGGQCGICGENWNDTKHYEKGGDMYLGKIMRTYLKNSAINVTIIITANHEGFFEFRICKIDGWEGDATQECLNKTVLYIENSTQTQYRLNKSLTEVNYRIQLPTDLTCDHCVLQWKWVTGNSWGYDPETQKHCRGCGPIQEQFYGCTDISIQDKDHFTTTSTSKPLNSETTSTTITTSTVATKSTMVLSTTLTSSTSTNNHLLTTQSTHDSTSFVVNQSNEIEVDLSNLAVFNGCRSKLQFGVSLDISTSVAMYCSKMCNEDCKKILNEYNIQTENKSNRTTANQDLVACIKTCPVLCDCSL